MESCWGRADRYYFGVTKAIGKAEVAPQVLPNTKFKAIAEFAAFTAAMPLMP